MSSVSSTAPSWDYMILVYAGVPGLFLILLLIAIVLCVKNRKKIKVSEVIDVDAVPPYPLANGVSKIDTARGNYGTHTMAMNGPN